MADNDDENTRRTPDVRGARMVAVGAVLGALLSLVGFGVIGIAQTDDDDSPGTDSNTGLGGLFGQSQETAESAPPQPLIDAPDFSCLTWSTANASDAEQVSCTRPHLFEVTGSVDLSPDLGPSAPFPTDDAWQQLITERCTAESDAALSGRFDPAGRYSVGAIKPSREMWGEGRRVLRCGLQSAKRSGSLYLTVGTAVGKDQSDVHAAGTCLGNDGLGVGDPVDCAQPHAVEVVGVVNMSAAFPGGYPVEADQDRLLTEECGRIAAEYAGGPQVVGEKSLTVFWETLSGERWDAGSKRVDCRLGAFLPDRSGFAPVTGSVIGEVVIGDQPALEAESEEGPSGETSVEVADTSLPGPLPAPAPPG